MNKNSKNPTEIMKIGLIDVDGHNYPNLALMKLSAYHKSLGDTIEWYDIFGSYDIVYLAKVFTHTEDYTQAINNAKTVIRGGTGYDIHSKLPEEAEFTTPDYSLYPNIIDRKTAYGFLTRGCVRNCPWCIVPKKEGMIHPYQDIEQIATNGRTNIILMDNNILAAGDYATLQLQKIIKLKLRVDFNQAMDARLVTDETAHTLAKIRWIRGLRFGCDTPQQIHECERAIQLLRRHGCDKEILLYTMLHGDIHECLHRTSYWKKQKFNNKVIVCAQPFLDLSKQHQNIPKWQLDMARWANKHQLYKLIPFEQYKPRKDFSCKQYLKDL